jgi:hypothetical protein
VHRFARLQKSTPISNRPIPIDHLCPSLETRNSRKSTLEAAFLIILKKIVLD